ncbi:MAG: transglutaminase family protein [Acidimicrobiia bacterium]|nr:transglutaminase family protein [Acidimicrobiia bacterium]
MTLLAEAATGRALRLEQHIRYEYSAPVARLRQRLMVVPPPVHGGQYRTDWALTVHGATAAVRGPHLDSFGNVVLDVDAARVPRAIEFHVTTAVERTPLTGAHTIAVDERYLRPTQLTAADARLRALADGAGGVDDLCRRAHGALTYDWGITGVRTTAAEAVRGGRGVCQDFAQVMIAACRSVGVAARYVSGHLVGEGGSHAWVEALVPHPDHPGRWVVEAWDPTHDRRAGDGYVTLAVGRDYTDVAPLSGSYVAGRAVGHLEVSKRLVDLAA